MVDDNNEFDINVAEVSVKYKHLSKKSQYI